MAATNCYSIPSGFGSLKGRSLLYFGKFVFSSMPIGAKLTIVAYIGTYYAIGSAWILTLANYFMMGWYVGYVDQFYLDSFAITFSIVIVFTALGNLTLAILRYMTNEKSLFAAHKSPNSQRSNLYIEINMYAHQSGRTSDGSFSFPSSFLASPYTSPKHYSRTCSRSI